MPFFLFLMMWFVPCVLGQTPQTVSYEYDAAGNRILRSKIITMKSSSSSTEGSKTKSAIADPNANTDVVASSEIQKYEDLLGERKVTIYPNPTQGLLRVDFHGYGDMKAARLLLFDMHGKLLRQMNKVDPSNTLDLSQYPAGMYILQMIEGNAKSEWKIVKEQ